MNINLLSLTKHTGYIPGYLPVICLISVLVIIQVLSVYCLPRSYVLTSRHFPASSYATLCHMTLRLAMARYTPLFHRMQENSPLRHGKPRNATLCSLHNVTRHCGLEQTRIET